MRIVKAYPVGFGNALVKLYEKNKAAVKKAAQDALAGAEPLTDHRRLYNVLATAPDRTRGMWNCAKMHPVIAFVQRCRK